MNTADCPIEKPDLNLFYAQIHRTVYSQVLYITRCPQVTEDITQDVCVKC
jgi:DNA-directed RNA polymerase specialized sigma24 family protein